MEGFDSMGKVLNAKRSGEEIENGLYSATISDVVFYFLKTEQGLFHSDYGMSRYGKVAPKQKLIDLLVKVDSYFKIDSDYFFIESPNSANFYLLKDYLDQ